MCSSQLCAPLKSNEWHWRIPIFSIGNTCDSFMVGFRLQAHSLVFGWKNTGFDAFSKTPWGCLFGSGRETRGIPAWVVVESSWIFVGNLWRRTEFCLWSLKLFHVNIFKGEFLWQYKIAVANLRLGNGWISTGLAVENVSKISDKLVVSSNQAFSCDETRPIFLGPNPV